MVNSLLLSTQYTFEKAPHLLKLKSLDEDLCQPLIDVMIDGQNYLVKTATTPEELHQVMKLRFEVFFGEFSTNKMQFSFLPYDIDKFDFVCDHLIVKEKASGKVVACYRLLTEEGSATFYSENEFELSAFKNLPGKKVELGRACVHKDHRQGTVIGLLWKGLSAYARKAEAKYLFGCSSIAREDFINIPNIFAQLKKRDALIQDIQLSVMPEYAISSHPKLSICMQSFLGQAESSKGMGSLMNMYMLAGAKFSPLMAYDSEMDCMDLLTIIDFEALPAAFERRFAC